GDIVVFPGICHPGLFQTGTDEYVRRPFKFPVVVFVDAPAFPLTEMMIPFFFKRRRQLIVRLQFGIPLTIYEKQPTGFKLRKVAGTAYVPFNSASPSLCIKIRHPFSNSE